MSSNDVGSGPCPLIACREAHPERRAFPVFRTLIGAIVVVNVASAVLTLIE